MSRHADKWSNKTTLRKCSADLTLRLDPCILVRMNGLLMHCALVGFSGLVPLIDVGLWPFRGWA